MLKSLSGYWTRRLEEGSCWYDRIDRNKDLDDWSIAMEVAPEEDDLRELMKLKADKHREYYKSLSDDASEPREMAPAVAQDPKRQRRTGVYEMKDDEDTIFKSVKVLRENYMAMLQKTERQLNRLRATKDHDDLLAPPPSGYCSSTASGGTSDDELRAVDAKTSWTRYGSSDSAMGHSDVEDRKYDEQISPYSPRGSIDHENVPSKTLIEAQCVPYPVDRKLSDCASEIAVSTPDELLESDSRRQSCFTDDGDDPSRYRYWRTPSVVVSDYSDDILGLTLEDIEYMRAKRRKEPSSSPDSSQHSSCSNLNYCGSTISSLDSEYILRKPFRKSSNCSTCSTLSGDEDCDGLHPIIRNKEICVTTAAVLFKRQTLIDHLDSLKVYWAKDTADEETEKLIDSNAKSHSIVVYSVFLASIVAGGLVGKPDYTDDQFILSLFWLENRYPHLNGIYLLLYAFVHKVTLLPLAMTLTAHPFFFSYSSQHHYCQSQLLRAHIKHLTWDYEDRDELMEDAEYQNIVYERLCFCIKRHVEFVWLNRKVCNEVIKPLFPVLAISGYCLGVGILMFFLGTRNTHIAYDYSLRNVMTAVLFIYAAIGTFCILIMAGQTVEDDCEDFTSEFHNLNWYLWNHKNRTAYILLLQNVIKPLTVSFTEKYSVNIVLAVNMSRAIYSVISLVAYVLNDD